MTATLERSGDETRRLARWAGAVYLALGVAALIGFFHDPLVFLRLHVHGVLAEEMFWGLWLLPFGLLVMRSRFLPRILEALATGRGAPLFEPRK